MQKYSIAWKHPIWFPARLVKIVCIRGKGCILRLMTLLSSRKSDTHRTLPSFFGIIKVGDAHLEAPHFWRTPISHCRKIRSAPYCP